MNMSIHSIWVYPVKSFRGYEVKTATLTAKGIQGDRQWMVVKPNNRMLTQRQAPQMANILATLTDDELVLSHIHNEQQISTPSAPQTTLDTSINVKVHKDTCIGTLAPNEINQWITSQLKWPEPLRLVKFTENTHRESLNPERFGQDATYFADAAPYLIANIHSIDALNNHTRNDETAYETSIAHFRPNIVLRGLPAFNEHNLSVIEVESKNDKAAFSLIDACQRCVMITVNPQTGEFTNTLRVFTELAHLNPMPNNPKAPAFGINAKLIDAKNNVIIEKGNNVTVNERK